MKSIYITLIALIFSISLSAQTNEKEILGTWISEKGDSKFEFYNVDNQYYCIVTWLKEPAEGVRIGDDAIRGLTYNTNKNVFENGTFRWGKNRLDCEVTLLNNKELQLKITKMLFTREVIWRKVKL